MEPYSVDGLAVGTPVAPQSWQYKRFNCRPSEQYENSTWCNFSEMRGGVSKAITILHLSNNIVTYINKELSPAFFTNAEVDREIARLSDQFNSPANIHQSPKRAGVPGGIIATWGDIKLQPLTSNDLATLRARKNPRLGILVDFLVNPYKSARGGLPVYSLVGSKGFVWIARFDQRGKGELRFFAADPSQKIRIAAESAPTPPHIKPPQAGKPDVNNPSVETNTGCWSIANAADRLVCYDAVAKAAVPQPPPKAETVQPKPVDKERLGPSLSGGNGSVPVGSSPQSAAPPSHQAVPDASTAPNNATTPLPGENLDVPATRPTAPIGEASPGSRAAPAPQAATQGVGAVAASHIHLIEAALSDPRFCLKWYDWNKDIVFGIKVSDWTEDDFDYLRQRFISCFDHLEKSLEATKEVSMKQFLNQRLPYFRQWAAEARQKIVDDKRRNREADEQSIKNAQLQNETEMLLARANKFVLDYKTMDAVAAHDNAATLLQEIHKLYVRGKGIGMALYNVETTLLGIEVETRKTAETRRQLLGLREKCKPKLSAITDGEKYINGPLFFYDAFGNNNDFTIGDYLCYFVDSRSPMKLTPISADSFRLKIAEVSLQFDLVRVLRNDPSGTFRSVNGAEDENVRFALVNVATDGRNATINNANDSIQSLLLFIQRYGAPPIE